MTCKEIDERLMNREAAWDAAASEHLRSCERCRRLAALLRQAQEAPPDSDPAVLERVAGSVLADLRPVRPLPPAWVFVSAFLLIFAVVSIAGAARLGMYGIRVLSGVERVVIFPLLGIGAWLAAIASAGEMAPGGRRRIPPAVLAAGCSLALALGFALLFRDYRMDHFLAQGIPCLVAGLSFALLSALLLWFLLRRGFVLNPPAAGVAAGTLAGLAGVGVLELHCPNLKAMHVLVWHVAVVAGSSIAGFLAGWITKFRLSSRT